MTICPRQRTDSARRPFIRLGVGMLGEAVGDTELVQALAAGRVDALEHLYARYGSLAHGTAMRVLRDPARAEEAVQDSFLQLWRNASRFDARRGSVKSWVLTIVRTRSIDYLRGRHAHERRERELPTHAEASGPGADPWAQIATLVDRTALQEALADLPADQRGVIELAYLQGYSQSEVAQLQGVPLSTVKGRVRLAIKKLDLYLRARGLVFPAAHDELQTLIAPYLLGACEHGEAEVMQAHLELCDRCRDVARELARAVSLMSLAPLARQPSNQLRERILKAAGIRSAARSGRAGRVQQRSAGADRSVKRPVRSDQARPPGLSI